MCQVRRGFIQKQMASFLMDLSKLPDPNEVFS
jgi:hypothetical protein